MNFVKYKSPTKLVKFYPAGLAVFLALPTPSFCRFVSHRIARLP
jgi:hypothetical protein